MLASFSTEIKGRQWTIRVRAAQYTYLACSICSCNIHKRNKVKFRTGKNQYTSKARRNNDRQISHCSASNNLPHHFFCGRTAAQPYYYILLVVMFLFLFIYSRFVTERRTREKKERKKQKQKKKKSVTISSVFS